MANSTILRIAEIALTVQSPDEELIRQINARYDNFLAPEAEPEIRLELEVITDAVDVSEDPEILVEGEELILQRRDFRVHYHPRSGTGRGVVMRNMFCFDSFLRVLFSLALMDRQGLLIHGSSIKREDKAFVFFGVSGSGKTTVARLSPEYVALSDEISAVRKVDGQYRAFGTPFWGERRKNGENISAPLGAMLLLTKDREVFLNPLSAGVAVSKVLPGVRFFSPRKALLDKGVDQCVDLVRSVPCYDMHFLPDNSFWRVIADVVR